MDEKKTPARLKLADVPSAAHANGELDVPVPVSGWRWVDETVPRVVDAVDLWVRAQRIPDACEGGQLMRIDGRAAPANQTISSYVSEIVLSNKLFNRLHF